MKLLVLMLLLGGCAFALQYFPISAFHVDDTTWYQGAGEDSLGLNHIWIGGAQRKDSLKIRQLQLADVAGLKGTLYNAVRGDQSSAYWNHSEIAWYYSLFWTNWEVDSANFYHYTGTDTSDASAQGNDAWVARKNIDTPGSLIQGPRRGTRARTEDYFEVDFILKIDSLGTLSDSVCSLWVQTEEGLRTWAVVIVDSFGVAGEYDTITLSYYNEDEKDLHYGIYWYGTRTLWVDYIQTKDQNIEDVLAQKYDTVLTSICGRYDSLPALRYYYLMDEPDVGHFAANRYLMKFLKQYLFKPGIQTVSALEPEIYQLYTDSVLADTGVLLINYYPLKGGAYGADSTPWESGQEFQDRLDTLCTYLGKARLQALQHNSVDFWFMCQSFGQYDTATGQTKWYREPTPRELKCMTWLALAYGAKGLERFTYKTIEEHDWIDSGLTCNGEPRCSLWTAARAMNFVMRDIGVELLTLTSDIVFKFSGGTIPYCFIEDISDDDTVQIGTFHNTYSVSDTFFIMVNRLCQASDSDTVAIKIYRDSLFLADVYSGEVILPDSEPDGKSFFSIFLPPAEGRFFKLVPFVQDSFKINNNETYANMVYAALKTKAWSSKTIDSMKLWQTYVDPQDTTVEYTYSTGWIPYDTAYVWYLRQGVKSNTVKIQYKVDGVESPVYSDAILFDTIAPSGAFVINDDSAFTNTSSVTLKNSLTDINSGMAQMRFGNQYLENIVHNSGFNSTEHWFYDTAIFHASDSLFEIPVQATGNYFYQSISPESLEAFENDTLLLWMDVVSDGFSGDGRVAVQYIYYPDTTARGTHVGVSITIPEGTHAHVSHYNLDSLFRYYPPPLGELVEVRVGVFIDSASTNAGTLYIDNLRLDVVSPADDYTHFEDYATPKDWTLIAGNGVRKVYGQFSDGAGNETAVLFDSIIVDSVPPMAPYTYSEKSDNDLVLTWNKVTTDTLGNQETMDYYVVYRDTAPSFIPDSLDSIGCTIHPETTYTDSNALSTSDCYYYLVKAVDAAQNTSKKSNMAFKFNKFFNENPLTTDRNWVSLPWHCDYDSVSDVTDDLSASGNPLIKIVNLRDDQQYESWLWDPDFEEWYGDNFDIMSGRGYEMITTTDTSLFLVGSGNPDGLVTLNENPSTTDRNWVSIPYNAIYGTVQDITEEYCPSGNPLIKITNLRNDQLYESWLWADSNEGWYGTNFTIERGRGYEFVTTVDTTWNPTEYSNESGGLCWARPKDRKSSGTQSIGSSCVPDRAPAWVYNAVSDKRVINRDVKHAAYHCPALYTPNKVIAENIESVYRDAGYSSTSETRAAAQKGGLQPDEQEKISHVVRAYILDASAYEAIVFTAYCLDRPKDVLTEQMVGSAVVQNNDVAAVWFDAGNFQVPWKEGEEAVFIVEAIRDGKPYIDVENFKLDETVDIQELGVIKFEPSFGSGSQGHSQSLLMCKPTNDNVIGYSLYQNGKRHNERVLQDERSIPPDMSMKLVIVGGHETVYDSRGVQGSASVELPLTYAFDISPNPFTKTARINYALPAKTWVKLVIYDVCGRKIKTLFSEVQNAGCYSTMWNGKDDIGRPVSSGIYFIRFEAPAFAVQDKILLVN